MINFGNMKYLKKKNSEGSLKPHRPTAAVCSSLCFVGGHAGPEIRDLGVQAMIELNPVFLFCPTKELNDISRGSGSPIGPNFSRTSQQIPNTEPRFLILSLGLNGISSGEQQNNLPNHCNNKMIRQSNPPTPGPAKCNGSVITEMPP